VIFDSDGEVVGISIVLVGLWGVIIDFRLLLTCGEPMRVSINTEMTKGICGSEMLVLSFSVFFSMLLAQDLIYGYPASFAEELLNGVFGGCKLEECGISVALRHC
jgi:hypothetical protein